MTDRVGQKSNPIRDSKNRIKLGVFGISGNGAAFTFHPDRFKCTWDANVRLAQKAAGQTRVPHSWHDYQRYWRESVKLRELSRQYGHRLDEFDGMLFAGRGRELLNNPELHWEYGFRLLQLAVWRELTAGKKPTAQTEPRPARTLNVEAVAN